jgi:hypothetical protein
MLKKLFLILTFFFVQLRVCGQEETKSPLEKITITSSKATLQMMGKSHYLVRYIGNVDIKFSDGSSAKSDSLEAEIENFEAAGAGANPSSKPTLKKLNLSGNVQVNAKNYVVRADSANFDSKEERFLFRKKVSISRAAPNTKDFLSCATSDSAELLLGSKSIKLSGSEICPVKTHIDFGRKKTKCEKRKI